MLLSKVRDVRRRLVRDGPPWTRDGGTDFATVSLPERDCDLLRDLLTTERAATVVEVGLAYASSALAIGEALVTVDPPHPRHLVIDPLQDSVWSDVGWDLLRAAGLEPITTLIRTESSIALARLHTDGLVADAAFVDGSHRFHEVFVDLYYLRKIVRPGGLIILDDHWAPSVRTAARYYERNLGWVAIPEAFSEGSTVAAPDVAGSHVAGSHVVGSHVVAPDVAAPDVAGSHVTRSAFEESTADAVLGEASSRVLVPRCRAFRLPDRTSEPPFEDFNPF